jgi:hypothetical protein
MSGIRYARCLHNMKHDEFKKIIYEMKNRRPIQIFWWMYFRFRRLSSSGDCFYYPRLLLNGALAVVWNN